MSIVEKLQNILSCWRSWCFSCSRPHTFDSKLRRKEIYNYILSYH